MTKIRPDDPVKRDYSLTPQFTSMRTAFTIVCIAYIILMLLHFLSGVGGIGVSIALLCLAALLLHRLAAPDSPAPLLWTMLFAALSFGLLPLCAGLVTPTLSWRLALAGAAVMGGLSVLFQRAMDHLRTTPASPLAVPMTALLLYLSTQVFSSIWL